MRRQRVCQELACRLAVVALTVFLGCTARTQLLGKAGLAGDATGDSLVTANATGGQSLPSLGGSTTSHPGTGGSSNGGAHASGGASGTAVGGAHASGGTGGMAAACLTDPDCVIAYDVTQCCPTCPAALPRTLVAAEPCLIERTESVPFECRPLACPDVCEMPVCALNAQYARCVQGACLGSRCRRGYTGDGCRLLTEADLAECRSSSDCIVVPYAHCCGATKRAINRLYLEEYHQHPEWQSFGGSCVATGVCRDDSQVTTATCNDAFTGSGRCELVFP